LPDIFWSAFFLLAELVPKRRLCLAPFQFLQFAPACPFCLWAFPPRNSFTLFLLRHLSFLFPRCSLGRKQCTSLPPSHYPFRCFASFFLPCSLRRSSSQNLSPSLFPRYGFSRGLVGPHHTPPPPPPPRSPVKIWIRSTRCHFSLLPSYSPIFLFAVSRPEQNHGLFLLILYFRAPSSFIIDTFSFRPAFFHVR